MAINYNEGGRRYWTGNAGIDHGFTSSGSNVIMVEGIVDIQKRLSRLQTKHPNMQRDMRRIMQVVIREARKELLKDAKGEVGNGYVNSSGDPRKAYRAIKSMVYKRIFGGNVNIISRRKRGKYAANIPPQKDQGTKRGGNRRKRSNETQRMMSYWGEDRGFILRWLNNGTKGRRIRTSTNSSVNKLIGRGRTSASLDSKRNGFRGKITGTHWFGTASREAMYEASEMLTSLIDRAITEVWGSESLSQVRFGNHSTYR